MDPRHCLQLVPESPKGCNYNRFCRSTQGEVVFFVEHESQIVFFLNSKMKKIQIFVFYFQSFSWKTWDFGESSPQSTALVWSFWSAASTSASVSLEISRFQNCNHCENVVEKNRLQKTKEKQKCILYAFHYIPIYILWIWRWISTPLTSPLGVLTRQVLSVLRVGCQAQRTARTGHTTTPRPFIKKKQDKERTWESFSFPKKSVMPTEQRSSSFQRSQLLERQSHTLLLHCYDCYDPKRVVLRSKVSRSRNFSHALEKIQ